MLIAGRSILTFIPLAPTALPGGEVPLYKVRVRTGGSGYSVITVAVVMIMIMLMRLNSGDLLGDNRNQFLGPYLDVQE
jgi:hypothetical protein